MPDSRLQACDQGKSFLEEVPDSPATIAYQAIINQIRTVCESDDDATAAGDGTVPMVQ